ncbi:cation-translocating P-type ATPase [Candidatus Phytoplasma sacchari]|uniref:Cation-transporting P-type ATPase n=1 Tax=Candidatus Phytoplasma sacchari TaxID=2609813 RepID=A0ABY7M4E7_9MOLU|nr:cation-transporting P-type ATPase [Candidatus Phytoplasma sacchari]
MKFSIYNTDIKILEKKMKTNFKKGLTTKQVKENFLKYGFNTFKKKNKISLLKFFLMQFNNFFIYILLISSLITFSIGIINNEKKEILQSFFIFLIIIINALLSCFYEKQKEKSLMIVEKNIKIYSKVLRNGKVKIISREKLVPGDIIFLEQGDIVPADLRIIDSNNLKINESILTGENLAVDKNNNLNIKSNINLLKIFNALFMDTSVISGYAKALVIKTGLNTQIGKITKLVLKTKKIKTPLEKNIDDLTKKISLIILVFIIFNLILNLLKYKLFERNINFLLIKKMVLSSVILAVAVIPEGLLAIITIILALGIKKIAQKKAIIKNLKNLETLGAIDIVCTDKTGTLTKNKMKIKRIYLYQKSIEINESFVFNPIENYDIIKLIYYGLLCNIQYIQIKKSKKNILDPVDKSFVDLANLCNLEMYLIKKEKNIKIKEFPFDNYHKFTLTIYKYKDYFLFIMKGACEILLKLSSYIEDKKNIFVKKDNEENIIEENIKIMSQTGDKILTIAYSKIKNISLDFKNNISINEILELIKNQIVFLGVVAIEDPIRNEIKKTIGNLLKSSITPIMITGDHLITAKSVALQTGILQHKEDLVITGDEIDELDENELKKKISSIKVYARVNPEHKLRIVQTYQKIGHIVAMIGDGVNDAPSIRQANVGISMGITGSEITKQAADIILLDDNFVTLQKAILEGRNVFDNIKKSILFLLSCNIGEICVILLNTCIGHLFFTSNFYILNSLQILWINLVTDSLVAIGLGFEPKDYNIIKQKPRKIKNALLNKKLILKIILEGILIGFLTFLAAFIGYKRNNNSIIHAQTFAFMVLSLSQLVHVFNLRNIKKSIFTLKNKNNYLISFFIISFLLQISIFFIPIFKKYFHLSDLFLIDQIIIMFISSLPLLIVEIFKFFINKYTKINKLYSKK